MRSLFLKSVLPITLIVLWQLAIETESVNTRYVPSPAQVLIAWKHWIFGFEDNPNIWYSGSWFDHVLSSTFRVFFGFLTASVLGVSLGILIGWYKLVENLIDPLLQIIRPIPITAWIPFSVIIFGIHDGAAIFLIALGAFFPIVINSTDGAQRVSKILVRAALSLGTKPSFLLLRVVIPSALPSIFTGLRLGIGLSWVLVIVAELLAVDSGLGRALWTSYEFIRIDLVIAAMLSIGFLGFISDRAILVIRSSIIKWTE